MRRRISTEYLSGFALRCRSVAFLQSGVRYFDRAICRMRVPRRTVASIKPNTEHSNDVIFELDFVVFGVRRHGILKPLGSGLRGL